MKQIVWWNLILCWMGNLIYYFFVFSKKQSRLGCRTTN